MKKTYYYYGIIALAVITISPAIIFAENSIPSSSPLNKLRAVTNKVEQNLDEKRQNMITNKDIRNTTIEARENIKNASTTRERKEIRTELRRDVFKIELNRLISQLGMSMNNLKQIKARIETRIEKATQTGRDMSKANSLLVIANNKIILAEQAINSLKLLATSTSTNVQLEKPRQIGASAIKAVNDTRKALNDVVVAIAHGMGLKLGITTTSTATTTNTTE